jgi:hypothetical protein
MMTLREACDIAESDPRIGAATVPEIIEAMRVIAAAQMDSKVNFWEDNSYACYVTYLFLELDRRGHFG